MLPAKASPILGAKETNLDLIPRLDIWEAGTNLPLVYANNVPHVCQFHSSTDTPALVNGVPIVHDGYLKIMQLIV